MTPARKPVVLFVDDDTNLLQLVQTIARRRGTYDAEIVSNVTDAIERINSHLHCYDAIVTDYDLPDLTGIGFLAHVRQHNCNVPLAVMTAHDDEEIRAIIESANARFIPKNLSSAQHVERIEALIEARAVRAVDGEMMPVTELKPVRQFNTCEKIDVHPALQRSMHHALEQHAESGSH